MVKITSDSTCDLGAEVEKRHIGIMPLKVILDADSYLDAWTFRRKIFFRLWRGRKCFPRPARRA